MDTNNEHREERQTNWNHGNGERYTATKIEAEKRGRVWEQGTAKRTDVQDDQVLKRRETCSEAQI